jgi:hypothetical protein
MKRWVPKDGGPRTKRGHDGHSWFERVYRSNKASSVRRLYKIFWTRPLREIPTFDHKSDGKNVTNGG